MAQTLPPRPTGDAPPASRSQQARATATRETILDEAIVEFAREGYRAASLARIVKRSGVTKGALYFHFTSKEALAVAVVEEMEAACRRLTAELFAQPVDPLRRAVLMARFMVETLDGAPVFYAGRRLCNEGVAGADRRGLPWSYWQQVAGDLFAAAHHAGLLRSAVDPVEVGRLVTDLSAGVITTSRATVGPADLRDRLRRHWEFVLGATANDAWLAGWRVEGGMARVLEGGG